MANTLAVIVDPQMLATRHWRPIRANQHAPAYYYSEIVFITVFVVFVVTFVICCSESVTYRDELVAKAPVLQCWLSRTIISLSRRPHVLRLLSHYSALVDIVHDAFERSLVGILLKFLPQIVGSFLR